MRRKGRTRGNNRLIPTYLLAALVVGSLCVPLVSAQSAESYRQHAVELSRAKSWDEAIANYRKALVLEPKDATTHYDLAWALKYKGETREALKEFEAALKLRPKWADAHYGLGAVWYDLQDQTAALKELRAATALDPANAAAHRLLARVLSQQNNLVDAEHELSLALRLKPSAETHLELGVVEGQLGKLNDAIIQFRHAIRVDPRLTAAHLMLGVALRRQANHSGALEQFRT